ncbi:MAG TPA: AAA family ATPase [Streptosporangiaceae bacterium]|nr:AAA family ATPase [Streptosporangiaceae bacterium]
MITPDATRPDDGSSVVTSPFLVGRDAELAQIESVVGDVAHQGATLRIAGDPGVGKSALLLAGTELAIAHGYTALSVRATEGEAHLAFAALHQLLRPILGRIDELPAGHRAALMSAFGLAEPGAAPASRFFIALAALELLADAAAETPVLVGVDDLSWLDEASLEAIEFISRRITDEQIVMVTTCRLNRPPESTFGSRLLWLEALGPDEARELLWRQAPNLSPADEARVLEAAAGNPLALLELAKVVEQTSESSLLAPIPLTQRLERSFAGRLDDLEPPVRTALLVAAVQGSDQLSETYAALAQLTGDRDARTELHKAARLGILIVDGGTFRFRHPLVQSAIAQSATPDELRAVHQALAATLGADPDRAVWHRALAAACPKESLAAELDAGADRAAARGAPGLAEEWLRRAAELSEDDGHRGHRLLLAAELSFELGRHESVAELMSQARALTLDPSDYARLAGLEGAFDDGIPGDADNITRLVEAADRARRDGEAGLAASLLLGASNSCYWGAASEDLRGRVRSGIEALALDGADPRVMVLYAEIDPFVQGARLVDQLAHWAAREVTDVALLGALARTAFIVGDFERGLGFATRAADLLRRQGRIALLTQALVLEAFASLYLGRWDTTLVASDEAFRFGFETRQPLWAACGRLGQGNLAGLRADPETALDIAAEVEKEAVKAGNRALINGAQLTRGLAALGDGRPGDAFEEFRLMLDRDDIAYQYPQCAWAIDYLAESASLSGRGEEALNTLRHVEELTRDTTASGVLRALAYARAVLAGEAQAEALFGEAIRLKVNASPWYCARVDLAHGSWLRRQRRVAESRRPLASAQAVFDALGAAAWSARAMQELAAAGRRARQHEPDAWSKLSAQELQVAQLAAQGLTNREIGERLYLSHRTVGSHLYRVFPKLGVRSRAQLHLALGSNPGRADDPGRDEAH